MHRFFKNILWLFLLVLPLGALIPLTLWKEYHYYLQSLTMTGIQSVAVCSHSQTEISLNPDVFPELKNASHSSCPLEITFLKFQDVVKVNGNKCKVLLLDISPTTCRELENREPWTFESAYGYECIWWFHHPGQIRCFPYDYAFRRMKDIFRPSSTLTGGFVPKATQAFIDEPVRAVKASSGKAEELNRFGPYHPDTWYFQESRKIITYAREHGITVVLLTTPLHHSIQEQTKTLSSFNDTLKAFSAEMGCLWINHLSVAYPDSAWADGHHLNRVGAMPFSKLVRTDLISAGLLNP